MTTTTTPPRETGDTLAVVGLIALAGTLFAGYVKATPLFSWIPVDLTLFGAVTTATVAALRIALGGRTPAAPFFAAVALFGVFCLGAFQVSGSEYAATKVLRLFTITAVCAISPALLVRRREHVLLFIKSALAFAIVVVALTVVSPAAETTSTVNRAVAEGSSILAGGRAGGFVVVAAFALAMQGSIRWALALPIVGLATVVVLTSGSRGPLLAAVLCIAALAVASGRFGNLRKVVGAVLAMAAMGYFIFSRVLDESVQERFALLFQQDQGDSVDARRYILGVASRSTQENFFGVGWGGLETSLAPLGRYPHNIVAEIFAEAGWLAGAVFCAYVIFTVISARRGSPVMLPLIAFWLLNAMVSGDINDNRALFAFLGVACASGAAASLSRVRTGSRPRTEPPIESTSRHRASPSPARVSLR